MNGQFKAELLKIRSTRTTVGLVLGMIALTLLFSLLSGLLTKAPNLVTTEDQRLGSRLRSKVGVIDGKSPVMIEPGLPPGRLAAIRRPTRIRRQLTVERRLVAAPIRGPIEDPGRHACGAGGAQQREGGAAAGG